MKRKIFLILISQIVIFLSINVIAEDLRLESLELKTYYPSPWGSYRELQVTNQMWIGHDVIGNPLSGGSATLQVGGVITPEGQSPPPPPMIYAYSNNPSSLGVIHGYAENTGVESVGVRGISNSAVDQSCGVFGSSSSSVSGKTYGVKGLTESSGAGSCGVRGDSDIATDAETYGVYGQTGTGNRLGIGVRGDGQYAGVYGSGGSYAGYFEGNLKVTGLIDFAHFIIRIVNDISEISSPVKGEMVFLREKGIIIFDGEWKKYDGTRIP